MNIVVSKKYVVVPLGYHAKQKRILFYKQTEEGKKVVYDVFAAIDYKKPDYYGYLDISRFHGEALELTCDPALDYDFEMTDELPKEGLYEEKYRPAAHFSASYGWINDPNGCVYDKKTGLYHLFFQYNPAGHKWGNMHWGHAVSRDLLHWEEWDQALFTDEFGTMFSGSAIINDDGDMMLFYTASGSRYTLVPPAGSRFTQCIAFSKDGGKTFEKYDKNPIIPYVISENRDPKVIYCPEIEAYVLVLFLSDHDYALYKSQDLLHWDLFQKLVMPGDDECPDFYPLLVDGDPAKKKWVFSGAHDHYLIGEIKDGKFVPDGDEKQLHYGKNSYAAQTFSGLQGDDGVGRRVRIAWNRTHAPFEQFNCSMCFPTQMELKTIDGQLYLCSYPISEAQSLWEESFEYKDVSELVSTLDGTAYDIELELDLQANSVAEISVFGMEIKCSSAERRITMDDASMPLYRTGNLLKLRLLIDTLGVEIYQDQGQAFMCNGAISDYTLNKLSVKAAEGHLRILNAKIHKQKNIWGK